MRLSTIYKELGAAAVLDPEQANAIVADARPLALAALGRETERPEALRVAARCVEPAHARGGSLVPAWPIRQPDGSVVIEFVQDWGAFLGAWRAAADEPAEHTVKLDTLVRSGQRVWVGIANDVLQLFVPDPPLGTYSMVRHHALMLVAATLWLGPSGALAWQTAHAIAGRAFLRRTAGRDLWAAIDAAERGLADLLTQPESHLDARAVVAWLERDQAALATYQSYLGAASLGVAALLASALDGADDWLPRTIRTDHADPDFNRQPIERFALVAA